MNIKILFARWIASRIESRSRSQRRALRDYQRREFASIHELEKRSRGLRLYVAWSARQPTNVVRTAESDWNIGLPHAA